MESQVDDTIDPGESLNATRALEVAEVFDRQIRVTRALHEAPGSETLSAVDIRTGEPLVIKTVSLDALNAGARLRLEQQQTQLQHSAGDWLAPLTEIRHTDERLYCVRKFVPGRTLEDRLRGGAISLGETLALGRCLLTAIRTLHSHGVLHQNIKPSNLIVDDGESVNEATLVDGGLWYGGSDAGQPGKRTCTALYLSPEQAGSIDYDMGESSDLYAVGLVLFECIAGRPPFQDESVGALLLQHMTAQVPRLRVTNSEVPRAFDDLIQRLLRKDPRDRYQSAEAALADLEQIAHALASGVADPTLVLGLSDRRRTLTAPAFVSRKRELDDLRNHLERARSGHGGLVLVEGESGQGKTRLLAELAQRANEEAFWVLRGQAQDQVGQRPLQLLVGIVQGLLAASRSNPGRFDDLRERLGHQADAVAAALPELASLIGDGASAELVPEAFGEARTIEALARFLEIIGSPERPALIILDDCQWADEMMIRLIVRWQARLVAESGTACHNMLVVGFRTEEISADHRLRKLQPAAHVRLSAFHPDEIRQLVESMAGPLPSDALELILRLSDGSPFMASAVLHGLIESGALLPAADGWRVEPLRISDLQSSNSAAEFLMGRIERLHPHTIELLSIGAILGKEFELEMAAALTSQAPSEVLGALDEARQKQLIWVRPSASHGVFVHDRLRSALLDRLPLERHRELHAHAALYLRNHAPDRVFDLAYHFDAAGDSERALDYALKAAEQARAQHSLQVAAQQYGIADRGARSASRALQYRIVEGLGEVLMLRGDYAGAEPQFERATALAESELDRAQITGKRGELAFKRGEMESATRSFEEALRLLGRYVPRSSLVVTVLFVYEALVQTLHTLFPRFFIARLKRQPSEAELLSYRFFSRLAHGYWFTRSKIHVLWTHLRGMNLAERYPPTLELGQSYSEHAPAMSLLPLYGRGIDYAKKSLAIRTQLGDLWGQGQSLHYHGVVLFSGSRYHECVEKCREAVRLLERTGDFWEVHIARYQIAAALYRLGDLQNAIEEAQRIHKSGLELGDQQASGISLDVWSRATQGAIPQEVLQAELERHRPDAQGTAQVLLAEGARWAGTGDHARAAAAFERALAVAKQAGVMNAYVSPNLAWLASALRCQAQADSSYLPRQRRRLLRRAALAATQAVWVGLRFRNDLPHALREAALLCALSGWVWTARKFLTFSLSVAHRQEAEYEYAQSLDAQATLAKELGRPEAEEQSRKATALLRDLKRKAEAGTHGNGAAEVTTFSLIDRFDVVLSAGRKIGSALTADDVFAEVRQGARRLLRGEHCDLVALENGALPPDHVLESSGIPCGRALMSRALEMGRAVAVVDEAPDGTAPGKTAVGASSSLCAPIFVRGAPIALLCVAHEQVRGLFKGDEERLADFITAIAGAALENADGFLKLQQLNATLEQRVADRTAAAENRAHELNLSNRELERIAAELRLTEEQLRIAKEAAESASRAKSQFLATMSHEIRTPMNGVMGMTELALQTVLTSQQKSYLQVVKQSADALLRLLNDILDFSKIEAGRLELEEIPFDLRENVGDAVRVLAGRATQNGLELMYQVAPDVQALMMGDAGRLRQILMNLVGNAIKFTREGEIFIDVRTEAVLDDAVVVRFSVRDTGIGIPLEKQQRIFESFSQADSSITRRFGGTGLGLAISSQLAGLMHGKLWVESEPGEGSTFHLTARFGVMSEADGAGHRIPVLPSIPVLIVDDHITSLRVLKRTLSECGLRPQVAENAETALPMLRDAAAAGTPFRLAIIDTRLTGSDGWSLARRIRSEPDLVDCPLILQIPVGHVDTDAKIQGLPQIWQFTKPAKISELTDAIREALGLLPKEEATPAHSRDADQPSMSVLLVEDGVVNQEVACGLLEMKGYRVKVANNGREALEILANQTFDVVLMDLEMPEMDGISATVAIRERERGTEARIPVIAMTAHAVASIREQCLNAGMDGYITKPIEPNEMFSALDAFRNKLAVP